MSTTDDGLVVLEAADRHRVVALYRAAELLREQVCQEGAEPDHLVVAALEHLDNTAAVIALRAKPLCPRPELRLIAGGG